MQNEPTQTEPRKKVAFEIFKGGLFISWTDLCQQAADFANTPAPSQLITIVHSEDKNVGVVVVWYWAEAGAANPN